MGAATERERNIEKSLKFVLKRMIGRIRKGWVYWMGWKGQSIIGDWNEGGLCSQDL